MLGGVISHMETIADKGGGVGKQVFFVDILYGQPLSRHLIVSFLISVFSWYNTSYWYVSGSTKATLRTFALLEM